MISKRLLLNDVDYTRLLLKDGLGTVKFESQDEAGNATIGSLRFRLSNMNGDLDGFTSSADRIGVKLYVNDRVAFIGSVDPEGFQFDRHNRIVEAEAVSLDAEIAEKCKKTTFSMLPRIGDVNLPIRTGTGSQIVRNFAHLNSVLRQIANFFSLSTDFTLPSNIVCGGTNVLPSVMKQDMTLYDFLNDICMMFNMVWTVHPSSRKLIVKVKKDYLIQQVAIQPLSLPLIRESLKVFSRREGWDIVTLQYSNFPTGGAQNDPRRAFISRDGKVLRAKDISLRALRYPAPDVAPSDFIAVIPEDDVGGNYIIRTTGPSSAHQLAISALDLLFAGYRFELFGLSEQEATYSLIDDSSSLTALLPLFYTHWQTVYPNPWPFFHQHFVRSAELDLSNRVVHIKTIGYSNLAA